MRIEIKKVVAVYDVTSARYGDKVINNVVQEDRDIIFFKAADGRTVAASRIGQDDPALYDAIIASGITIEPCPVAEIQQRLDLALKGEQK